MSEQNGRPVVVTTKHRGVFFGYAHEDGTQGSIELDRARMCVYWPAEVRGVLGLASGGPSAKSRVTHALSEPMKLYDVTAVMGASSEAVEAWEKGPWS